MKLFPLLTLFLPPCTLKNRILNLFAHKKVHKSAYIGFSFISVKHLIVEENAKIKHLVRMKGLEKVLLKRGGYIGNHNSFYCNATLGDKGGFALGENSELVRQNALDLTSNITIGNNVVIGGYGSQFWTHGFDVQRNRIQGEICIADNVYIGSSTIFNLSVSICSNVSVGAGSVVSKPIIDSGFYAGVPAIKKNDNSLFAETDSIKLLTQNGTSQFFEKKI